MRIIAGSLKGKRLSVPRHSVRPTSERLRGSLFSALGDDTVVDSFWLDAFAGSGVVGIEALSRGARHVVFNDRDRLACEIVKKNLHHCNISSGFSVVRRDAFSLLRDPSHIPDMGPVNILFLDPPYDFERYRKLLAKALTSPLTDSNTLLILEVFKKTKLDFIPEGLSLTRTLKGGDSHLLFLASL